MNSFPGLRESTPEELAELNSLVRCKAIDPRDYSDFEAILRDPQNDPRPHMRAQRQDRNDCQGQALANGEEKRRWYCTGEMVQLSDIYAYNASEYVSHPNNVGDDRGTSIASGVKLLTQGISKLSVKPGLPTEAVWPYGTYERSAAKFESRARQVQIDDAFVSEHQPMPEFDGMLAGVAAGGSGHIGTYWGVSWSKLDGMRLMGSPPTSGDGHATEIIWAVFIDGEWYLVVWNSHGDRYYLMSRRCYEALRRNNFAPFGGYLLLPDKPVERYHDRRKSGGGYWSTAS